MITENQYNRLHTADIQEAGNPGDLLLLFYPGCRYESRQFHLYSGFLQAESGPYFLY